MTDALMLCVRARAIAAKPANCRPDSTNATFHLSTSTTNPNPSRDDESEITIGRYSTDLEKGTCVWRLHGHGEFLDFPHYFDGDLTVSVSCCVMLCNAAMLPPNIPYTRTSI